MKSAKTRKTPEIQHRGSLMTYQDQGRERCFGYLLGFPGHGIFEPTFGKLEVSSREAKTHNELLSQGELPDWIRTAWSAWEGCSTRKEKTAMPA